MFGSAVEERLSSEDRAALKRLTELKAQLISPPPMIIKTYQVGILKPGGHFDVKAEGKSDSYLRNFLNLLTSSQMGKHATGAVLFQDDQVNFKDTSGTLTGNTSYGITIHSTLTTGLQPNTFNNDNLGIVIGTGSTAVTEADYALDTQIADGEAGGEMVYLPMVDAVRTWNAGPRTWTVVCKRYFWNRSGGSITVAEIGWIVHFTNAAAQGTVDTLVLRDVLSSGVVIADDRVCQATYTFTTAAFPS